MDAADLQDLVEFEEGKVVRRTVFEADHLWAQMVSLGQNGSYGPVSERDADAMLTIVAGEAVFLVDKKRKRLKQWGSVLVPAGAELVVRNASTEPLVILMVAAPPPPPRAVSG
ncbi:MAG: cupin domain-containing protein [Actinomycetota bacterium]